PAFDRLGCVKVDPLAERVADPDLQLPHLVTLLDRCRQWPLIDDTGLYGFRTPHRSEHADFILNAKRQTICLATINACLANPCLYLHSPRDPHHRMLASPLSALLRACI